MKFQLLILVSITSICFQVSFKAHAETIPYKNLIGVWTASQGGINHDLTDSQAAELCEAVLMIVHPDRHFSIHIRVKKDGELMMSMDVLSMNPCSYANNQFVCEMESTAFGKPMGGGPGFFGFQKIKDGVYDVTALKPDGKTVDQVQTFYPCSMTIPEAQARVEANSGPEEIGEKLVETINTLEKHAPQIEGGKKKKIELLKKQAKSGDGRAQAGLGTLHLMAAVTNIGVEHDPERGITLLNQAAEKKVASAYVMLGSANMIPGFAFPKQDFETAYRWYEKAAKTERADALNTAGMMKLFGLGTKQDGPQAVEWMTLSSKQGNPSAHFNLGIIRVFFPEELKQRWKVSLEQDHVTGMMHINLAAEQGHEPSQKMLQFLNKKRHPKLAYPAQAKAKLWKKKHPQKHARNRDYPDSIIEMDFKIEGGQIKFMDANINAKLVWSLGAGGAVVNQDNVQKNGNKQFLLNKWWGFDNCAYLYLWDEEGNEYGLYNKKIINNPMQRYINDEWWIATYGKPGLGENKIKGEYHEIKENIFSYVDANYKFKTRNNKTVLVLEYLEYTKIDKHGNKIKEDVSEWGEIELFECKISNIRETKEFSDQLEHIKKMFNKK
jgi:TPR repeat protein/mannose-6-phosphate isomerase-like protein (cupin superfamily)